MSNKVLVERIKQYVEREGACQPGDPELIDDDVLCPVWRVSVLSFGPSWTVPPPLFWYVCPEPVLNLYRSDLFHFPKPQPEKTVIDHFKSFHLGLAFRLQNPTGGHSPAGSGPVN